MHKLSIPLLLSLAAVVAWGCGDKLMLVMRLRLAQLKTGHPIAVLAYVQRDLPSSTFVRQIQLQPAVKKAGHRFQILEDTTRLDDALKAAKYDVVIADVSVADVLNQRVRSSPYHPIVLPVGYKTSKAEESATQKKYHCLLKTPSDSDEYFEAIDQALQWKMKAGTR